VKERVKGIHRESDEYEWEDLTNISEEEKLKKLKKPNEFKAFGVYGVSNAVLKN